MDKKQLINSLKKHDLTCGWDMVCCYQEDILNEMLAAEYTANRLDVTIPIHSEVPAGFIPGMVNYDGSLQLKAPTISFTRDGRCNVTIGISSGTIAESFMGNTSKELSIGDNTYQISGIIDLSAISGSMTAVNEALKAGSQKRSTADTHSADTIITFDGSSEGNKMLVYLDFSTLASEGGFSFTPISAQKSDDADPYLIERVKVAVNEFFKHQVDSFRYILGGIQDIPKNSEKNINLFPKSCLFSMQNSGSNSSLNIYMQISDSINDTGNYPGHTGTDATQFPDEDVAVYPIPDGSSASIAISHSLLTELYIRKECTKKNWTCKVDTTGDKDGFKALLTTKNVSISTDDVYKASHNCTISTSSKHAGINIGFNDIPLELIFKDFAGKFSWSHPCEVSYEDSLDLAASGTCVSASESYKGDFTYTISCDKPIELSAENSEKIHMSFSLDKDDYKQTYTINNAQKTRYASVLFFPIPVTSDDKDHAEWVISSLKDEVSAVLPSFSFDFGELNLFFAANLLFPGKHTFTIDQNTPFAFPSDMMVFGTIKLPEKEK